MNLWITKNKVRVREHGEVFTPPSVARLLVREDGEYLSDISHTVLEPCCGRGVFLVEILKIRLDRIDTADFRAVAKAVCTLYGSDVQLDNVIECRENMLRVLDGVVPVTVLAFLREVIERNVAVRDFLDPSNEASIHEWLVEEGGARFRRYGWATWLERQDAAEPVEEGFIAVQGGVDGA